MRSMNLDSLWTQLVSATGLHVLTKDTAFSSPIRAGLDADSRMVVSFRIYLTPLDREARVLYIKDPGGEWFVSGDLTLVNALNDRLADALISAEILADLSAGQRVWLDLNA